MFVLRFHNTFLLKLGILGLLINLAFFSSTALAFDIPEGCKLSYVELGIPPIFSQLKNKLYKSLKYYEDLEYYGVNLPSDYLEKLVSQNKGFLDYLLGQPNLIYECKFDKLKYVCPYLIKSSRECREVLRRQRFSTPTGITYIQFLADNASKSSDPKASQSLNELLGYYLADTGEISKYELNLIAPVNFGIFNGLSPEQKAVFFSKYRTCHRQNILHLIPVEKFDEFAENINDDSILGDLLISYDDTYSITPLHTYSVRDVPSSLHLVRLLTVPNPRYFNTTRLMYLAAKDARFGGVLEELRAAGVDIDQKDDFGNTAEMINKIKQSYDLSFILQRTYESADLNDTLWQDIRDRGVPYVKKLESPIEGTGTISSESEFIYIAQMIMQTQPQTPIHRAFWQLDTSDSKLVVQSKHLWRSFFETLTPLGNSCSTLPLSGNVLLFYPLMPETKVNVISGASSFGVRFGKATPEEGFAMLRSIHNVMTAVNFENYRLEAIVRHLGYSISGSTLTERKSMLETHLKEMGMTGSDGSLISHYTRISSYSHTTPDKSGFQLALEAAFENEVNTIKNMFFRTYKNSLLEESLLDDDQRNRLFRHRLKCTVVALCHFINKAGLTRFKDYDSPQGDVFGYIDETLSDKMPAGDNARALYQNVKGHLRRDLADKFCY